MGTTVKGIEIRGPQAKVDPGKREVTIKQDAPVRLQGILLSVYCLLPVLGTARGLYCLAHSTAAATTGSGSHEGTAGLETHQGHQSCDVNHRDHCKQELDDVPEGCVHSILPRLKPVYRTQGR